MGFRAGGSKGVTEKTAGVRMAKRVRSRDVTLEA